MARESGPRRPTALWELEALGPSVRELSNLLDLFEASDHHQGSPAKDSLADSIRRELKAAADSALDAGRLTTRFKEWISGARVQFVASSLNAAEVTLLRLAPLEFLGSNLQVLFSTIARIASGRRIPAWSAWKRCPRQPTRSSRCTNAKPSTPLPTPQ